MAKFAPYQRQSAGKRKMSPLWYGIGCILIIVVPLAAYWLTGIIIPPLLATGLVPSQLVGHVRFPAWFFRYRILAQPAGLIGSVNNLWLDIITFLIVILILFAIISLIYSLIYAIVGPPTYSEFDAPPAKYKPKKYTR
jgi:hypothetical protein